MMKFKSKNQKGFTLVELMIIVVIIGILVAIALPSYHNYIRRANRVDARNAMQEVAQRLEELYTANRSYVMPSGQSLTTWGLDRSPTTGTVNYEISFSNGPTATEYTIEAVPQGGQSGDECGTFTLDQRNIKTAAGQEARDDLSRRCWR